MSRELVAGDELQIDSRRLLKVRVTAPVLPCAEGVCLDTSAFLLTRLGRVVDDRHFVFYGNTTSPDDAVKFREIRGGDNVLDIDLGALSPVVDGIQLTGTIYEADRAGRTLADITESTVRISDSTGQELAQHTLRPVPPGGTQDGRTLAAIFRRDARWVFRATDDAFSFGLRGIASGLGVQL